MYFIKTRNWYCNRTVFDLLNVTEKVGVVRGDLYTDGDGKFILETRNELKAWAIWLYFILLKPFSGGWTYIIRPGKELIGGTYKSIY